MADIKKSFYDAYEENKKLEKAYKYVNAENDTLKEILKSNNEEILNLKAKICESQQQNENYAEELKELEKQRAENAYAHKKIEELNIKIDKLRCENKELKSKIKAFNKNAVYEKSSEENTNIINNNSFSFPIEIEEINDIINGRGTPRLSLYKEVSAVCRLGSDFVTIDNTPPYFYYLSENKSSGRLHLYPSKLGAERADFIKPLFDIEYTDNSPTSVASPAVLSAKSTGYTVIEKGKIYIYKSTT